MTLLSIRGLKVAYPHGAQELLAVDGVDFDIGAGEFVGLAGESGCGKSTLAMSIPGLLPTSARIAEGTITFDGQELTSLDEAGLNLVRWNEIAVVFQGALNALNPVQTIGSQILEPILVHEPDTTKADALARVKDLLDAVGIPPSRAGDYPHQFSGGMRQRVMIAMALACRPKLVIADEPITALDVMTQAQILDLLQNLCRDFGLSMLLISHDLSVLAQTCDRVAVMYAGKIVESGPSQVIFARTAGEGAQHPYTRRLINAYPNIHAERVFIDGIPGNPPDLSIAQIGCRFQPRCDVAEPPCSSQEPTSVTVGPDHTAACLLLHKATTT